MANFEIGLVYRKGPRFFIAVSPTTLVSCQDGIKEQIQPRDGYDMVRSISVEELCLKWEIELYEFDALMSAYLKPPETTLKTRPRGTKRRKTDDDEYWRRHRTGRIAKPSL